MKVIKKSTQKHHVNRNRISIGIGTGISILLAFSCIVGADSILSDSGDRTEGEYYDMIAPDYTTEEVIAGGTEATVPASETTSLPVMDQTTTVPSSEETTPATSLETTAESTSAPSEPTETTAPSEPVATSTPTPSPKPTRVPTPTSTPIPTPTPKPTYTEEEWYGVYYTTGEVNVRKGPGTEYEITKTLKPGDAIEVVGRTSNGWFHTVRDTYVNCDYCSSEPPVTPKPTRAPTPTPKPTPKPSDPTPKPKKDPTPTPEPENSGGGSSDGMTLVGSDFKITFYGPDYAGPGTDNRTTSSGTTCKEGRTVAVDPSVIPVGTKIYIENDPLGGDGYYVAEDTGWGVDGHHIDIFAEDGESMSTLRGYTVYTVN